MEKNICTLLKEIKIEMACGENKLAKEIGASQATVNRILNGQTECLSSTYQSIFSLHKKIFGRPVNKLEPDSYLTNSNQQ